MRFWSFLVVVVALIVGARPASAQALASVVTFSHVDPHSLRELHCMVPYQVGEESWQSFILDPIRSELLRRSFGVKTNLELEGKKFVSNLPPSKDRRGEYLSDTDVMDMVTMRIVTYLNKGVYESTPSTEIWDRTAAALVAGTTPSFLDVDTRSLRMAFTSVREDDGTFRAWWVERMQKEVERISKKDAELRLSEDRKALVLVRRTARYRVVVDTESSAAWREGLPVHMVLLGPGDE